MLHRTILWLVFAVLVVFVAADGHAAAQTGTVSKRAQTLIWLDVDIPGSSKGLKLTSIHGDYSVADSSYTIRLKFPDGYVLPPHYHSKAVNLTVLSGTFMLGHGAKATAPNPWPSEATYGAGDFLHIPATRPHYCQVNGETVVQFQGVGPFGMILAK